MAGLDSSTPHPVSLTLRQASRVLDIAFDNGESFSLPCEYLRVFSPSAEIRGHGGGPHLTIGGKIDVNIVAIEPVGHYAVRLQFDDGHNSGIYSWSELRELGINQSANWQDYLSRLEHAKLRRTA
ncbi:DUF971 domain-containing protein [Burkholderiaceae bacterium DAT-1]|nr:DUF971 domain-containing protein [Burkholderiaceae bacterium DAT-1]